ncbi:MAG: hypothetical protein JO291_06520, partial [Acidimicrobiia bacterium]|nr:hypothetical protein [Acidimicrobiia bacterium]
MSATSRRARYAFGSTVVALLLALLLGALPYLQGASADSTRELVRVSFRPANTPGLTGWRTDNGAPFDARRAYGWVRDNAGHTPVSMTQAAVTRSARAARSDTFIAMQPPKQKWGRWDLAVAPGTYRVTVTVGDPSGSGAHSSLAVEGQKVVDDFHPTKADRTDTETADVRVTDGRLTLDPLYPNRSTNTKLVSVVVSVVLGDDTPTTQPPTTQPPTTQPPTTQPPTTEPPTTEPPTTEPPVTVPPSGLGSQTGFGTGGAYMSESDADINREFDGMVSTGATWVRLPILWSSIEQSPGVYWWSRQEQVVGLARAHGLHVIANVSYTPKWARPAGCQDMKCAPADVDQYA